MDTFKNEFNKIEKRYYSPERISRIEALKESLSGKTIVLFGAGGLEGDAFWDNLEAMGLNVACFADTYAITSQSGRFPILRPDELIAIYPDATIIISASTSYPIIYKQLLELGYSDTQIINYPEVRELLPEVNMDNFKLHIEGYEWAYNFFKDDISKNIILQRINWYLFADKLDQSQDVQYFEKDVLTLSENEVFVDAGFYTGDTSEEFIRKVKNKYKHIYGFEADKFTIEKCNNFLEENENITLVAKVLYSYKTVLKFKSYGNSMSCISDDDTESITRIDATSLDIFFADKAMQPTFIKMDIEGGEQDALLGSKHVIETYKPKLALSVYHKVDDIYKMPQLIESYRSDYEYTLRHYTNMISETIMYAK